MQNRIAIFLIIIFTTFIVSPTIISAVEKNFDISILFNINEEEENTVKKSDLKIYSTEINTSFIYMCFQKKKNVSYTSKNYISQYPKILTPPPECVL